jgi:hypothetical protein
VTRKADGRHHRAVSRQHDMNVRYYTLRAQKRHSYTPAPVEDFLRLGESYCPGDHTEEQGCEDRWLSYAETIRPNKD